MERAIKIYECEQFLKKANEKDAILRKDPVAWAEIEKERAEWDVTLMDGLDDDEY